VASILTCTYLAVEFLNKADHHENIRQPQIIEGLHPTDAKRKTSQQRAEG